MNEKLTQPDNEDALKAEEARRAELAKFNQDVNTRQVRRNYKRIMAKRGVS